MGWDIPQRCSETDTKPLKRIGIDHIGYQDDGVYSLSPTVWILTTHRWMLVHTRLFRLDIHLSVPCSPRKSGKGMNIVGICFGGTLPRLGIRMPERKGGDGFKSWSLG
jgi:hypothetical protein